MEIEEVQRRAKAGPLALLARRVFALLLGVLTTVTIPHLVSPRAYGLSAMSAVILSLADMFKDFGLTTALMRKGHVDPEEVNFLFWFNAFNTVALAALLAAFAPAAGTFFHEPEVTWVILASLVSFTVGGLTLQHRALLSRDLRFSTVALIDTGAAVVQFLVTLMAALVHFDVWAIVLGNMSLGLFGGIACTVASGWRPTRPRWIAQASSILRFGANASAYSIAGFISNNMTPVLFGRFLGPIATGQYNRANAILILPQANGVEPIAQAALPVLARLRPFPDLYRKAYLTLLMRLNIVVVPASIMLLFCGDLLVNVILGAKWALAGKLLQALAPALAVLGFGYAVGDLFVSQDRSAEMRNLGMIDLVLRPLGVGVGILFGPLGAAVGYSITTSSVATLRIIAAGRRGPVNVMQHLTTLQPAGFVAAGALAGCIFARWLMMMAMLPTLQGLLLILSTGVLVGGAVGLLAPISRKVIFQMAILFKVPFATKWAAAFQVDPDS